MLDQKNGRYNVRFDRGVKEILAPRIRGTISGFMGITESFLCRYYQFHYRVELDLRSPRMPLSPDNTRPRIPCLSTLSPTVGVATTYRTELIADRPIARTLCRRNRSANLLGGLG